MKRVTASEARRNWFRLLDEVASGAVVRIERRGITILVQRAPQPGPAEQFDYHTVLRVPDAENADRWGWSWSGPEAEIELTDVQR